MALLGRLFEASEDTVVEIIQTEDQLLDSDFFTLLSRLLETTAASGDQNSVEKLSKLQETLLAHSTFGKRVKSQSDEFEAAVKSLEGLGKELTREKLLDLLIEAPTETRLNVLVSLTRPGIDYEFFQLLSSRIDQAKSSEQEKLLGLREKLLELTRSIDQAIEARANRSREILSQILAAPNVVEAVQQNAQSIDEFFLQALSEELERARKNGDLERIDKIRQVDSLLQQASKPSREIELIQELLGIENEAEQQKFLEENRAGITPEFMETLGSVMAQFQSNEDHELAARIENLYRKALRFSMKMNM
jgi:hypothetical protein